MTILALFSACANENESDPDPQVNENSDYKQEMRKFVIEISQYAKAINPDFLIIPQNGHEIVSSTGTEEGTPVQDYVNAIDALGQEDLFYGYDFDNVATPTNESEYLQVFLDMARTQNKLILVTDYCSDNAKVDDSYLKNSQKNYVSFAASHRELDNIPVYPNPIHNANPNIVTSASSVNNFLYLINPQQYQSKHDFITAVRNTNYDMLIMDAFFTGQAEFTTAEIDSLRDKQNGGKRLVVAYMSIGEAENYRYYWQTEWNVNPPDWLDAENPDWAGNFKVKYWMQAWKDIIFGNDVSYLKSKILDKGFDGVYLDIIEAFEYYE